jgi:AraC-like DNA-binding protein
VVECGWLGRAGWPRSLRVVPDGCVDLVWDGQQLSVVVTAGAPLRMWLTATGSSLGLRLRCGAAGSVLGIPISELPHGATPLENLWGRKAAYVSEQLPTAGLSLLESLVAGRTPDRLMLAAVHELRTNTVADAAGKLAVSERGLRRKLREEVGYGPKRLHRVLRFREFVRRLPAIAHGRTSLAVVAADLGYADQSHLGRECLALSGSTPARLAEIFQTTATPPSRIEECE